MMVLCLFEKVCQEFCVNLKLCIYKQASSVICKIYLFRGLYNTYYTTHIPPFKHASDLQFQS